MRHANKTSNAASNGAVIVVFFLGVHRIFKCYDANTSVTTAAKRCKNGRVPHSSISLRCAKSDMKLS